MGSGFLAWRYKGRVEREQVNERIRARRPSFF
jgi:hypothetical protein